MSERRKKDLSLSLGRHKIERKGGKYIVDGKEMTIEDIIELKSLIQQLISIEHDEMLKEKKERGEKIYREVRSDGTVVEY